MLAHLQLRAKQAPVKWAQREGSIFLTIAVTDVADPQVQLSSTSLTFKLVFAGVNAPLLTTVNSGVGGSDKATYKCEIEFNGEIVPEVAYFLFFLSHSNHSFV